MRKCDGIKEGNVIWRIDFLGLSKTPVYSFSLEDAHEIARQHGGEAYIITIITGDRLQQEVSCGKIQRVL